MRHSTIIASTLVGVGLVAAVWIGATAGPAATPSSTPAGSITGAGVGRGVPATSVTGPDGVEVRVPASLPEDCAHAYVRLAPKFLAAREALKAILKGEQRTAPRESLERANVALMGAQGSPEVTAAILDCGSQDIRTSTAYREAREAVQGASIAANLIGDRPLSPEMITQFESDLASIEYALARL